MIQRVLNIIKNKFKKEQLQIADNTNIAKSIALLDICKEEPFNYLLYDKTFKELAI